MYKVRKERIANCYLEDTDNDGRHISSSRRRSHGVEMIEDAEDDGDDGYYLDSSAIRKKSTDATAKSIQPGPPPMRYGQKAMPRNVEHYDEISLPDLEHFASGHTWKGF